MLVRLLFQSIGALRPCQVRKVAFEHDEDLATANSCNSVLSLQTSKLLVVIDPTATVRKVERTKLFLRAAL